MPGEYRDRIVASYGGTASAREQSHPESFKVAERRESHSSRPRGDCRGAFAEMEILCRSEKPQIQI
jgi:hypothetical protein